MDVPEIPGYYFDEIKKKYFKITNGSLSINHKYHNNLVQSKKRKVVTSKENLSISSIQSISNKNEKVLNKELYIKLLRDEYQVNLTNIRLGLINVETNNEYLFSMLKNMKLPQIIAFDYEIDIIESLGNSIVINDFNTTIKIIKLQSLYDKNLHSGNAFQDIKVQNYYNALSRTYSLISPKITSACISDDLIFKSIIMHEIDTNISINFVKLHSRNFDTEEPDLTLNLIKSCSRLKDRVIKGKLNLLFGCNFIVIEGNTYLYNTQTLYHSNSFITFSKFIDGQLVIGNNNGEVFWINLSSNYMFNKVFFKKISKHSILKVKLYNDNWYIGTGSNVHVYDKGLNYKKKYYHTSKIMNFFLFRQNIILVGLKGLVVVDLKAVDSVTRLNYSNHNIVNQISKIIGNNLIVNESNSNLVVFNLETMDSFRINIDVDSHEKLLGITQANKTSELIFRINNTLNNRTKFLIYRL